MHLGWQTSSVRFAGSGDTIVDRQILKHPYPSIEGWEGLLFSILENTPPPLLFPASYRNNNPPPPLSKGSPSTCGAQGGGNGLQAASCRKWRSKCRPGRRTRSSSKCSLEPSGFTGTAIVAAKACWMWKPQALNLKSTAPLRPKAILDL